MLIMSSADGEGGCGNDSVIPNATPGQQVVLEYLDMHLKSLIQENNVEGLEILLKSSEAIVETLNGIPGEMVDIMQNMQEIKDGPYCIEALMALYSKASLYMSEPYLRPLWVSCLQNVTRVFGVSPHATAEAFCALWESGACHGVLCSAGEIRSNLDSLQKFVEAHSWQPSSTGPPNVQIDILLYASLGHMISRLSASDIGQAGTNAMAHTLRELNVLSEADHDLRSNPAIRHRVYVHLYRLRSFIDALSSAPVAPHSPSRLFLECSPHTVHAIARVMGHVGPRYNMHQDVVIAPCANVQWPPTVYSDVALKALGVDILRIIQSSLREGGEYLWPLIHPLFGTSLSNPSYEDCDPYVCTIIADLLFDNRSSRPQISRKRQKTLPVSYRRKISHVVLDIVPLLGHVYQCKVTQMQNSSMTVRRDISRCIRPILDVFIGLSGLPTPLVEGGESGGGAHLFSMVDVMKNVIVASSKVLTCSDDKVLVRNVLRFLLNSSYARGPDAASVVAEGISVSTAIIVNKLNEFNCTRMLPDISNIVALSMNDNMRDKTLKELKASWDNIQYVVPTHDRTPLCFVMRLNEEERLKVLQCFALYRQESHRLRQLLMDLQNIGCGYVEKDVLLTHDLSSSFSAHCINNTTVVIS
eukprot:GHVO01046472.1.p1 GENE.GHVO01046472.1~~GHVO01046472.1.p1  ORF type:complete len:642 (+),score=123.23 GHVO01046472.1:493-2418(+)